MKKKLSVLALLTCLVMQFMQVSAWADTLSSNGSFIFQISCSDPASIDLSTIELKIFAEQQSEVQDDGTLTIDEEYAYSLYPDQNGLIRFDPPAKSFSVNINLETLPDGWGAQTYTHHYTEFQQFGQIEIKKIATAEIIELENQYTVAAYDVNGFPLITDSKVDIQILDLPASIDLQTYSGYRHYNAIDYTVTAQVGDMNLSKKST